MGSNQRPSALNAPTPTIYQQRPCSRGYMPFECPEMPWFPPPLFCMTWLKKRLRPISFLLRRSGGGSQRRGQVMTRLISQITRRTARQMPQKWIAKLRIDRYCWSSTVTFLRLCRDSFRRPSIVSLVSALEPMI